MAKKKQTYQQFKQEFENVLMKRHGITINDCTDDEALKREYEYGTTAVEFVEWIAEKRDLDRLDKFPFTFSKDDF